MKNVKIYGTLLACIVLALLGGFYKAFYMTSGQEPTWVYATHRPFMAGWSEAYKPLFDKEKVYFCAGYGWWDHELSLTALDKRGQVKWQTPVQYSCEKMDMQGDKIFIAQKFYHIDKEQAKARTTARSGIVDDFRTLVIDKNSGKIVNTLPFRYDFLMKDKLYVAAKSALEVRSLEGKLIRKIDIPSAYSVRKRSEGVYLSSYNGLWLLDEKTEQPRQIAAEGRKIYRAQFLNNHVCYVSYDGKADLYYQNKASEIDSRITCRRLTDNKVVFEKIYDFIDVRLPFYMYDSHIAFMKDYHSKTSGYVVGDFNTGVERIAPVLPPAAQTVADTMAELDDHVIVKRTDAREFVVQDTSTGAQLWTFKSTGWLRGFVRDPETRDSYVYDDDGKLYAFLCGSKC